MLQMTAMNKHSNKDFSKSVTIHGEKTKEITTVKEVWICDLIIIRFGELLL